MPCYAVLDSESSELPRAFYNPSADRGPTRCIQVPISTSFLENLLRSRASAGFDGLTGNLEKLNALSTQHGITHWFLADFLRDHERTKTVAICDWPEGEIHQGFKSRAYPGYSRLMLEASKGGWSTELDDSMLAWYTRIQMDGLARQLEVRAYQASRELAQMHRANREQTPEEDTDNDHGSTTSTVRQQVSNEFVSASDDESINQQRTRDGPLSASAVTIIVTPPPDQEQGDTDLHALATAAYEEHLRQTGDDQLPSPSMDAQLEEAASHGFLMVSEPAEERARSAPIRTSSYVYRDHRFGQQFSNRMSTIREDQMEVDAFFDTTPVERR
jgi:hypothetical protein